MKTYVLLPNRMIAEAGFMDWAVWFEDAGDERVVAQSETEMHAVSTVFIGIDYRVFGKGPPLVFETMVVSKGGGEFDWEDDHGQWRYSSWDDAEAGHHAALRRVLKAEAEAAKTIAGQA